MSSIKERFTARTKVTVIHRVTRKHTRIGRLVLDPIKLRTLMIRAGISVNELAKRIGAQRKTVVALCKELPDLHEQRNYDLDLIAALCDALRLHDFGALLTALPPRRREWLTKEGPIDIGPLRPLEDAPDGPIADDQDATLPPDEADELPPAEVTPLPVEPPMIDDTIDAVMGMPMISEEGVAMAEQEMVDEPTPLSEVVAEAPPLPIASDAAAIIELARKAGLEEVSAESDGVRFLHRFVCYGFDEPGDVAWQEVQSLRESLQRVGLTIADWESDNDSVSGRIERQK